MTMTRCKEPNAPQHNPDGKSWRIVILSPVMFASANSLHDDTISAVDSAEAGTAVQKMTRSRAIECLVASSLHRLSDGLNGEAPANPMRNMTLTKLRGNSEPLRLGPVGRHAPHLLEAKSVPSEIRAELAGIFVSDENLA